MASKLYKCPFCKKNYIEKDALYIHMEKVHHDELLGLSAKQIYFNWTNKYALSKGFGKSVISGKPTKFNEITGRYERFLPEEKEEYRPLGASWSTSPHARCEFCLGEGAWRTSL